MNNAAAWTSNTHLEGILIALEKRGPDSLPPRDIAKLISFIKNAVIENGRENGTLIIKGNYIVGLPANGYQREITAIKILAQRLEFSDKFHEWMNDRLRALAYRMAREHPVEQMEKIWRTMDENGRLSYIRAVHQIQTNLFSDDKVDFIPAQVTPKKMEANTLGTFEFDGNPLYDSSRLKIAINPSELMKSTAENATGAVIHEGIHSILRQLARMNNRNLIAPSHPLHKDAKMMHDFVKYDSYCSSMFREAYYADPEERIAHKHEDFARIYKEQSALRRHQVERFKARPE